MVSDRTVGGCGLFILITSFTYYTLWTLVTPFFPPSSPLFRLFPISREWAIRLPALFLLVGFSFVGILIGFVLVETAKKKRSAAVKRAVEATGREKGD